MCFIFPEGYCIHFLLLYTQLLQIWRFKTTQNHYITFPWIRNSDTKCLSSRCWLELRFYLRLRVLSKFPGCGQIHFLAVVGLDPILFISWQWLLSSPKGFSLFPATCPSPNHGSFHLQIHQLSSICCWLIWGLTEHFTQHNQILKWLSYHSHSFSHLQENEFMRTGPWWDKKLGPLAHCTTVTVKQHLLTHACLVGQFGRCS
jgi:hypothetical protein